MPDAPIKQQFIFFHHPPKNVNSKKPVNNICRLRKDFQTRSRKNHPRRRNRRIDAKTDITENFNSRTAPVSVLELQKLPSLENQEPHHANLKDRSDTQKQKPNRLPCIGDLLPRRWRQVSWAMIGPVIGLCLQWWRS